MGIKICQSLYVIQKHFSWSLSGLLFEEALQTSFNRFLIIENVITLSKKEFIWVMNLLFTKAGNIKGKNKINFNRKA